MIAGLLEKRKKGIARAWKVHGSFGPKSFLDGGFSGPKKTFLF